MKNILLLIVPALIVMVSCDKSEYELEKSVYRPDPDFPSLPAYTEWGYNTFGAYYERKLFVYNDNEVPAKVINTEGHTRFLLKGGLADVDYNDYYYDEYNNYFKEMTLVFELPGFDPDEYSDLVLLNDTVIDLADPDIHVMSIIDSDSTELDIIRGTLEFKKAQNLIVDKIPRLVILSGYFAFKAFLDGEPVSFSYGRFDVGIDEFNFTKY
jgi:hypothetical protein